MILLKSFFRKQKIRIYIIVFIILFSVIFLLNNLKSYSYEATNLMQFQSTEFILLTESNHDEVLSNDKGVNIFKTALGFESGKDGEIFYSPPIRIVEGKVEQIPELIDDSKMEWNIFDQFGIIPAFGGSVCGIELGYNEVSLSLFSDTYKEEYRSEYIGKEIDFKFNNQNVKLVLTSFSDASPVNHICISERLYIELLPDNEKFLYSVKVSAFEEIESFPERLKGLEDNDFFEIIKLNTDSEFSSKKELFNRMLWLLDFVNILSLIIFALITIFVIKDLVSDEEKDILLLKEIGFNKWQNMGNSLRNMIVLDIIVFGLSILVSGLIAFLLNIVCGFNLELFNVECVAYLSLFVILVELVFHVMFLRKY